MIAFADKAGDLNRLRVIASVFFEESFALMVSRLNLSWAVTLECRIRCFVKLCRGQWVRQPSSEELPVRLRLALIRLGPTFIKLGQVLSLRPDIVPPAVAAELSKLTGQVPPVPYEAAKTVVETDLGRPLAKLFKKFDKEPFAAGSLAQVYRAVLPDNTRVAVKVQRPGVKPLIEKDIRVLGMLARLAEKRLPEWRAYRPLKLVEEFADTIRRELDFGVEAVHAKRFALMFEGDSSVKVAKVFPDYSSTHVMTMELIEGVRLDDDAALARADIDKRLLARNGVRALLRQVFVEGFFHADPHPGNYFALPGSVFAFIDYGMAGRLSERDRLALASFFVSFINRDSESAISHLLHLADADEAINLPSFEHDVDDILHGWYGAKLKEVSLASTFYRVIESGRKHQVYFPTSFAYLAKALFTTEAMGRSLDPDFDFASQLKPYAHDIVKSELSPKRLKQLFTGESLTVAYIGRSLPHLAARLLDRLESGEIRVRVNQAELEGLQKSINAEANRRLAITVLLVVIIASGISYLVQTSIVNLHLSPGLFGLVLLIVLLWWIRKR